MLEDNPQHEVAYQKVTAQEKAAYWQQRAIDLTTENTELKFRLADKVSGVYLHNKVLFIAAIILLVANFVPR